MFFRDLPRQLVGFIERAEAVVGCVAWLTHPRILRALSTTPAAIVVQKEDFLRPDIGGPSNKKLWAQYAAISGLAKHVFGGLINQMSTHGGVGVEGVRCVGMRRPRGTATFPRMHHKFLVFCNFEEERLQPRAVWTGSFNFSNNAELSLENAVYIKRRSIAEAFLREFEQVVAISEPLNWDHEYVAPEWRIGS